MLCHRFFFSLYIFPLSQVVYSACTGKQMELFALQYMATSSGMAWLLASYSWYSFSIWNLISTDFANTDNVIVTVLQPLDF
jgi:hypothetical protein